MAKPNNIRSDIKDATAALKEIMKENLSAISQAMIDQVMANWRRLPESQRLNATNNVSAQGISVYKDALLNALAVIAGQSLKTVRKEIPSKQNVRLAEIDEDALMLGEFEKLPPDLKKRIQSMLKLLTGTQISDLEKVIFFQFNSAVDSTDSEDQLRKDLSAEAQNYVDGNSVNGASSASAAQIINEARLAFFTDDSVDEEIDSYEFINGDPVSPICQELAGQVFAKDDPALYRYWPPLHFNCKSFMRAVLKGTKSAKAGEMPPPPITVSKTAEKSVQFMELSFEDLRLGGPGSGRHPEGEKSFDKSPDDLKQYGYKQKSTGLTGMSDKLPDGPDSALPLYTENHYKSINNELRSGNISKENQQNVDDIDEAFNYSALKGDTTLYRGIKSDDLHDNAENMVGKTIEEKAFSSTTPDQSTANSFAKSFESKGIVLKVNAKSGTKALDLTPYKAGIISNEKEILLPRNTKYKITKVDNVNGVKTISVDIVD